MTNRRFHAAGAALAGALALAAASAHADAPGLLTQHSIATDAALELATTTLAQCRAQGFHISVTVLNRHARPVVVLVDDDANPHTRENSERKAYTAFTTRGPSGEVGRRPQPGQAAFLLLGGVTAAEGGLPILAGKELVGAVGVSGAPGGEKDTACAQAGIDRIAKALGG